MRILEGVWLDGKGPDCLPRSVGGVGTRAALGAVKGFLVSIYQC